MLLWARGELLNTEMQCRRCCHVPRPECTLLALLGHYRCRCVPRPECTLLALLG